MTKWYLDCVSDAGDAAIFYAARVSWHGVRLRYSSLLLRKAGHITSKSAMGAPFPTQTEDTRLTVEAPHFGMSATWQRLEPSVEKTLFANDEGSAYWHCVHPRAAAHLKIGDHLLDGLGYAECLTLTIPPWRLPLHRLQWGRWLSPASSLIWIDWSGPFAGQWSWMNGTEYGAQAIAPDQVRLSAAELRLDRDVTLRDGRLRSTVLPGAPFLARIFPAAMFDIREAKWLSTAQLTSAGKIQKGWAIHESVEWNR
jgi:hypothetical protein